MRRGLGQRGRIRGREDDPHSGLLTGPIPGVFPGELLLGPRPLSHFPLSLSQPCKLVYTASIGLSLRYTRALMADF